MKISGFSGIIKINDTRFVLIFAVMYHYCSDYYFKIFSACNECAAVTSVFLSGSQCHEDSVCHSRVLKRCKLIVSCLKKLKPLLLELIDHSHPLKVKEGSGSDHVNTFKNQGKFSIKNLIMYIKNLESRKCRQIPLFSVL
jgi:hypothetical protein